MTAVAGGEFILGPSPLAELVQREAALLGFPSHAFVAASFNDGSEQPRGMRGGEFLFDFYDNDVDPIWGTGEQILWQPGEGTMFAGPQGVGKSSLAQQLALSLIGVRPPEFLGFPVRRLPRGSRVLYLAMDRPRQIQRSFRRMVDEKHRKTLNNRLIVWRGPLAHLNVVKSPFALARWIEEEHPTAKVVIPDSYKDLAAGLSSDDVGAAINMAVQEVITSGREWLGLHHNRKSQAGNKAPRTLDDVYGSTFLTAGLGSVFGIGGEPGSTSTEMRHVKPLADPVGPIDILHDHRTGTSRATDAKLDALDVLTRAKANGNGGATLDEVALGVYRSNSAADKARARRQLEKLVTEKVARYTTGSKGGRGGGGEPPSWELVDPA